MKRQTKTLITLLLIQSIYTTVTELDYGFSAVNKTPQFNEELKNNKPAIICDIKWIKGKGDFDQIVGTTAGGNMAIPLKNATPYSNNMPMVTPMDRSHTIVGGANDEDNRYNLQIKCSYNKGSITPVQKTITAHCSSDNNTFNMEHHFKTIPQDDERFKNIKNHGSISWLSFEGNSGRNFYLGKMYLDKANGIEFDNNACKMIISAHTTIKSVLIALSMFTVLFK